MTLRTFEMGYVVDCKPVNKQPLEDAFNTHKINAKLQIEKLQYTEQYG